MKGNKMKRLSRFKVEEFLEELGEVAAREG